MNSTFISRLFRDELLLLNGVLLLYGNRSVHLRSECNKFNFISKQHTKRHIFSNLGSSILRLWDRNTGSIATIKCSAERDVVLLRNGWYPSSSGTTISFTFKC